MKMVILGLGIVLTVGCQGVQPAGPFANMAAKNGAKGTPGKSKDDGPPPPVTVPAVKPTPPLNLIYPDEVMADNPHAAAQKLMSELEADRKSMAAPPMTAEISRYKGGVKQN